MPLLKLWNSIRGRSAPAEAATNRSRNQPSSAAESLAPSPATKARVSKRRTSKGPRLSLFGGGGPHGSLCKLVKTLQPNTVLEISVGDGSRAIAVLQSLRNPQPVRYVAIDQFEMADGGTTLKAFHQSLRTEDIRPQVFPEPIERGLVRVANTVGAVDLVIIAAKPDQWQTPATLSLLARVMHVQTVVLYQQGESWERYEAKTANPNRRAA